MPPSQQSGTGPSAQPNASEAIAVVAASESTAADSSIGRPTSTRELRRARIVITVKRTESYKQWLIDNPLQAVIADDEEDDGDEEDGSAAVIQQER